MPRVPANAAAPLPARRSPFEPLRQKIAAAVAAFGVPAPWPLECANAVINNCVDVEQASLAFVWTSKAPLESVRTIVETRRVTLGLPYPGDGDATITSAVVRAVDEEVQKGKRVA